MSEQSQQQKARAARKKPNSPRAPGMPLKQAVSEVSKVYLRYSHGSFSRGELAAALGLSAGSGGFLGKAATLRDYGLIEEGGTGEKTTDLFSTLYSSPPGTDLVKRAAFAALQTSTVFARLLQQFPTRIPDAGAIALRLESQERFNRDRAKIVAAAFRTSMYEYGLIDASGNVLPPRDDSDIVGTTETAVEAGDDAGATYDSGPSEFRVEVPLKEHRRAVLFLPEDMTRTDVQRIEAVLRAYVVPTEDE